MLSLKGIKLASVLEKCDRAVSHIPNKVHLEAGGAPVHKLDGPLGLYGGNGSIHILWHNVTPVNNKCEGGHA